MSLPQTPSASDDEFVDVTGAIVERVNVPSSEDPESFVKSRLRDEADKVVIGETQNKIIYASVGAFRVFEDLDDMKRDVQVLKAKDCTTTSQIEELRHDTTSQIEELRQKVSYLESRVRSLVKTSEGYLAIRRRFLAVYKRDIKMERPMSSKAIKEGNISAHEGDALGDAALFQRDQRTDLRTYRELYGLQHQQVLDFSSKVDDNRLLLVLNAHGTMVAQGKSISNELKNSFDCFIGLVEDSWLQPTEHPELSSAYYLFWKHFNEAKI